MRKNLLRAMLLVPTILAFWASPSWAYDRAKIYNHTLYEAHAYVYYSGCRRDSWIIPPGRIAKDKFVPSVSHAPSRRGGCLIKRFKVNMRTGPGGKPMYSYHSSGTSYSKFHLFWRNGHYRVMSEQERAEERADIDGSPGFKITNKTAWPLSLSLDQIGCLYYKTVKPGKTWDVKTGAVWFTINAHIQPDGKQKTTTQVMKECVLPVAKVVAAVALAAFTGGESLGAMLSAGAKTAVKKGLIATAKALTKVPADHMSQILHGQYAGPPWPFRCTHKPAYEIHGGLGLHKNGISKGSRLSIVHLPGCAH